MQYLLLHFGYAFLVLGLIIEGDATLVAAMILASQAGNPYLDLRWVLGIALGVTVGGNELLYELGALGWVGNRIGTGKHYQRASRWLHSSRTGLLSLLFSRFMWGFRIVIPVAAGVLHIKRRRFSLSNLIGGTVWVALLAYFGVALQSLFTLLHEDLLRFQSHIAVGVFLLGILIGMGTIPWQIMRRSWRQAQRQVQRQVQRQGQRQGQRDGTRSRPQRPLASSVPPPPPSPSAKAPTGAPRPPAIHHHVSP
ncbi:MAG TPA: DedA family protein [Terriglobales bacterium]|nr:DedA family protein [Terriglobales bacterium]